MTCLLQQKRSDMLHYWAANLPEDGMLRQSLLPLECPGLNS